MSLRQQTFRPADPPADEPGRLTNGARRDLPPGRASRARGREAPEPGGRRPRASGEALVCTDGEGRILLWSEGARDLFGYEEGDVMWHSLSSLVAERERSRWRDMLRRLIPGEGSPVAACTLEGEGARKDGSAFPVELILTSWRLEGGGLASGVFRDASERLATRAVTQPQNRPVERSLPSSEPPFALAARAANDGLWEWDLTTGRAIYSSRWKALLGYAEDRVDEDPLEWLGRMHPDDAARVKDELQAHLEGASPLFESEHRLRAADGSYRWVLCRGLAARDRAGRATRIAGSLTDVTAGKDAERELVREALNDRVTGLPNRLLFVELLERAVGRVRRRPNYLFAVLVLDVDRFQIVNESLGHRAGDQLLAALARRLEQCLRPEDSVARFGGDEFAILLDDVKGVDDAVGVVSRIQRELARPFEIAGHEIFVTASVGIALGSGNVEQPEDMLRDAGIAVSRAKVRGRARHEVFDAGMHSRAVALLRLETGLRRALDRQEFRLHFQPVVSLADGGLAGVEALVRWQHPERGLLPPGEFIPLAEETGLIVPIERWVLREACRRTRPWQAAIPAGRQLPVTVNLSTRQFAQADLLDHVARTLRETGLEPRNLRLEITESALMQSAEAATPILDGLRALGIRLSIDDFGTGYSSLSYLHRFRVDVLKIDRSFVSRLGTDEENVEIVRAILALGRSLGLEVVAEGIETPEQLARLLALGCRYGQGFHFSPPVDAETARELIAGWRAAPAPLAGGVPEPLASAGPAAARR